MLLALTSMQIHGSNRLLVRIEALFLDSKSGELISASQILNVDVIQIYMIEIQNTYKYHVSQENELSSLKDKKQISPVCFLWLQ